MHGRTEPRARHQPDGLIVTMGQPEIRVVPSDVGTKGGEEEPEIKCPG